VKTFISLSCLVCFALTLCAAPFQPRATFSLEHRKARPPQHVIQLEFLDAEGEPVEAVIRLGEGTPLEPQSYELRARTDGSDSAVPVTVHATGVEQGYASRLIFRVDPAHIFSTTNQYVLHVRAGTLFLKEGGQTVSFNTGRDFDVALDNDRLALDQTFAYPKSVQNKLELLGGTGGGNASFRYARRFDEVRARNWLNAELNLKGDFNFLSENKEKYFNSLVGELKLFTPFRWNFPGTPANQRQARARFSEWDVHARVDSDQTFENADKVIGTSLGTYLKDPISRWLSSYHILNGFSKADEASVSPLLVVGYDYVSELKSDDDGDSVDKLDTHAGNHRARAILVWSWPLGRNVDIGFLGINRRIDADLLLELQGIYDFRVDEFLDQSRVSLNFSPRTASNLRIVYSLSWERGKAAPTFNDVHALLAGLKLNF